MYLNLGANNVGVSTFGNSYPIKEGETFKHTGQVADVLAGPESLGHVVDTLGNLVATAPDTAPLQYLTPFSGCAVGEWCCDTGTHGAFN